MDIRPPTPKPTGFHDDQDLSAPCNPNGIPSGGMCEPIASRGQSPGVITHANFSFSASVDDAHQIAIHLPQQTVFFTGSDIMPAILRTDGR